MADLYLAPILAYVALTPDRDGLFNGDGFHDWWKRVHALPRFVGTQPNAG